MPSPQRRVWDTSVIIDFLEGAPRAKPHVPLIIEAAERGETRIVVSVFAEIEVAKIDGVLTEEQEEMIKEFFGRPYVHRAQLDQRIAEIARRITRTTSLDRNMQTIKPKDAVHIATAERWQIPIFECYDIPLIKTLRDHPGLVPGVTVREPLYEGQAHADEVLAEADPLNQGGKDS